MTRTSHILRLALCGAMLLCTMVSCYPAEISNKDHLNQTFKNVYAYLGAYQNYFYDFSDLRQRQKLKGAGESPIYTALVAQEQKGAAAPISTANGYDQYVSYYDTGSAFFLGQEYFGMIGLTYSLYGVSQSVNVTGNAVRGIIQQRGALRVAISRINLLNTRIASMSSQAVTWNTSSHGGGTAYRYITEGELQPIQNTRLLRGGRAGETYFTKDVYDSGAEAQAKLALKIKPTVRVEFRILNNPVLKTNNTIVQPNNGQPGGGTEFSTYNQVRIQIISVAPLK